MWCRRACLCRRPPTDAWSSRSMSATGSVPTPPTSAERSFCHVYGRSGRTPDQFIPGRPYSFVAALESGRTS